MTLRLSHQQGHFKPYMSSSALTRLESGQEGQNVFALLLPNALVIRFSSNQNQLKSAFGLVMGISVGQLIKDHPTTQSSQNIVTRLLVLLQISPNPWLAEPVYIVITLSIGSSLEAFSCSTHRRSFAALADQPTALPEVWCHRSSRTLWHYSNHDHDDSRIKLTCLTTV